MATAPDFTSAAVSAGTAVGRAFGVVTLLPALFFVGVIWALFAAEAFSGSPNPEAFVQSIEQLSLGGAALLLLTAFAFGFALHPVQYSLTQLLEGYWGTTSAALTFMHWRVRAYRRHQRQLIERLQAAEHKLRDVEGMDFGSEKADDIAVPHLLRQQQVDKALRQLPIEAERVMPTRLGNILRRHEDLIGQPYGLPGVAVIAPLTLVARPEANRYLSDSAEQLDAAVSVCAVTAASTVLVVAATLTDGWWLLTALLPYSLCCIAYRGAMSAATGYGIAMRHLVDLDRFALYRELHLNDPKTLGEEQQAAAQVSLLLEPPPGLRLNRSGHPVLPGGEIVELNFESRAPDAGSASADGPQA
ncbi:hypothetical protein [Microbacterium sp. A93]|uniref:hypothetical protein n=1 Tax=Microbacterium sp. A93 TaxID=3450716 RepID=UPI003F442AA1